MACQRCNSQRVLHFGSKCSDLYNASMNGVDYEGYSLYGVNLTGGDYVTGAVCLDCGQLQGKWPVSPVEELESNAEVDAEAEDDTGEYIRTDRSAVRERKKREKARAEEMPPDLSSMYENMERVKHRKHRFSLIVAAYRRNG